MELTCHVCGYNADHIEFAYLCKNGCPACGESDLRRCPACGAECVFSRAESLDSEESLMKDLSMRLANIKKEDGEEALAEARNIIKTLWEMNARWNVKKLEGFLKERQKELFM